MGRTALVIGYTGLVGRSLVKELLEDDRFARIILLGRRTTDIQHPKATEHAIQFDEPGQWQHLVKGDVLFSCLGTTLKQAGSKEAQLKVDYTYQLEVAHAAAANGVGVYVLVSSAMAHKGSKFFYTRMKGELEEAIKQLPFSFIRILQPGLLTGQRETKRMGEEIGYQVLSVLNKLGIARNQRPVPAQTVAKAMIVVSFHAEEKVKTFTLLDVFKAAGE